MRVPCNANPLRGICTKFKTLDQQISSLQAEGAIDLSGYAEVDHVHDPPDLSGYATDAELSSGLAGKADLSHSHSGVVVEPYGLATMGGDAYEGSGAYEQVLPNLTCSISPTKQLLSIFVDLVVYLSLPVSANITFNVQVDTASYGLFQLYTGTSRGAHIFNCGGFVPHWVEAGGNKLVSVTFVCHSGTFATNYNIQAQPKILVTQNGPPIE